MPCTTSFIVPICVDTQLASTPFSTKESPFAWSVDDAEEDEIKNPFAREVYYDSEDSCSDPYTSDSTCSSPTDSLFFDVVEGTVTALSAPVVTITPATNVANPSYTPSVANPSLLDGQPWDFRNIYAQLLRPAEAAYLHDAAYNNHMLRRHIAQTHTLARKYDMEVPVLSPPERMDVGRAQEDARADAHAREALAKVNSAVAALEYLGVSVFEDDDDDDERPSTSRGFEAFTEDDSDSEDDCEVPSYVYDTPSSAFSTYDISLPLPCESDLFLSVDLTTRNTTATEPVPTIVVTPPAEENNDALCLLMTPMDTFDPASLDVMGWDMHLYCTALAHPHWAADLESHARIDRRLARQLAYARTIAANHGIVLPTSEKLAAQRAEAEEHARKMAEEWERTQESAERGRPRQMASLTSNEAPVPRRRRDRRGSVRRRCE